jgi:hypothetical protein
VVVKDLDADGKPDIATTDMVTLRNEGNRFFTINVPAKGARYNLPVLSADAIGDLNGDGKPDLVSISALPLLKGLVAVTLNASP